MPKIAAVVDASTMEEPTDRPPLPVGGSFLDEAHPGPAPHNPEVVEDENDTPEESLARAIIAAAREPDGAVPLTDLLILRETKNLAGCVSSVEVQTAAGHLLLGSGVQSALTGMLAVAEAIVLRLDKECRDVEEATMRVALANAEEHVREIRSGLNLPPFEVGQVWRLADTQEVEVLAVAGGRVSTRLRGDQGTVTHGGTDFPVILEYDMAGVYRSFHEQPHTIIGFMPLVLVKAAPAAPAPVDPKDKTWIDDDFDKPKTKE